MIKSLQVTLLATLLAVVSQAHAEQETTVKHKPHPRPCFSAIDTNSDGNITFKEFSAKKLPHGEPKAVFARIDSDNNGVISRHEFANHKPPHPPHHQGADHDK